MLKVYNLPDGYDRKSAMQMTLINRKGKIRKCSILSFSKDYGKDSKSITFFQSPADFRGTGLLQYEYDDPSKDDRVWMYLPAFKKVKRITGSSKSEYFMGSDFTYNDMGRRAVDEDIHKLLREETVEGYKCWVVESRPKKKNYMYSRVTSWIRQDAFIPLKVEFYDRKGNLLKILTVTDTRKKDGFWTLFKLKMDNIQEKHKTILEIKEIHYNIGLKDNLFRVSTLERGRLK
jgi:hypothetical protein